MDAKIDPAIPAELRQAVITRTFDAPRKLVWEAWTDPKHLREWWGPHGFDAPHPSVDLRPGGKMNLDMRSPDGNTMPNASIVRESRPPEKLVFESSAFFDKDGIPAFEVINTVTLKEQAGRTTMTLKVDVVKATAAMIAGLKGMRQGWGESLDKMAEHLDLVRWGAFGGKNGAKSDTSFVVPGDRPVVVIRRTFDAPRELVWRALTDPKMRAEWWGPARYTINVREFDARVGGKWRIDHLDEDGKVFAFSGEFTEVRKPLRLVNTFRFEDFPPAVETTTLSETDGKTTLTNVTSVDTLEQRKGWVETGMESGARESMDRMADLLARMKLGGRAHDVHTDFTARQRTGQAVERKVTHATFVIDRRFDAPPKLVFNAFADQKAKDRWFVGPPDWITTEKSMDFRVGGREVNVGGPKGGPMSSFDCRYYDIVPNERIVYAYEMYLDDQRISVSVATIEFKAVAGGTRLLLTEQGAFLDGFDNPKLREEGTLQLMDALARSLKKSAAA
jgi:uncharacterized protein YndB with AHSA1/START domain